ncbi:conserved hypothetical protein [Theileria orientalis strain Shintoku]|uniref:Uncharacterized protein n=1 Tax=Theileria orientalis strain Shintoku TaxID=869250 RepID=J4D8K9_THEOR|nr:conserved hypothetical protein [Theileria orientalis strain Shintoku]PVC49953.1 hypothetical protein MACL_00002646 [Theileria orientalis]BAM40830.1 conserved hypothetical protein [Theileria orientalis strain Shintoku]|eukprot:XP_009691131.1 conserved hypothetical protein [Theileria orientalis strain Shintoku]
MEALNRGPYAKLLPLNNGRYKRIVDPVTPQIFLDCQACFKVELLREEHDFNSLSSDPGYLISTSSSDKNVPIETVTDLNSPVFTKLYTSKLDDERESTPSSVSSMDSETLEDSEITVVSENSSIFEPSEANDEHEEGKDADYDRLHMPKPPMVIRGGADGLTDKSNWIKDELKLEVESDEGIPVLFYTKSREKPALLMLAIDHKMRVIYMRRNKVTRFFPIKLIDKIVASHQIIEDEFSKQIKHDPNVRVNNMVLFNASNFTDCVAIQFAQTSDKMKFIDEVYRIKNLIRKGL